MTDFTPPLTRATLLKRYKRFMADIRFSDGEEITVHVANPGSMMGLAEPGSTIYVQDSGNPKRKLRWSWQLASGSPNNEPVVVNTGFANGLVETAIRNGHIPELAGYDTIRREVKYGENSRIDLLLEGAGKPPCYVEVKSVTLSRQPRLAEFPDSKTARGAKHLVELQNEVAKGHRAVMVYAAMRADCDGFRIAADIDPAYDKGLKEALASGVERLCYAWAPSPNGIKLATTHPTFIDEGRETAKTE